MKLHPTLIIISIFIEMASFAIIDADIKELRIPKIDTPLATETFLEEFTPDMMRRLNLLLGSNLLKTVPWEGGSFDNERESLKGIKAAIKDGLLKTKYSTSAPLGKIGRVYPAGALSLGATRRQIRGTLTAGEWYDIDIENCHPVIVAHVCRMAGIPTPRLDDYIAYRDTHLNNMMEHLRDTSPSGKITRERAKSLFIMMLYGGGIDKWLNQNDPSENEYPITNWDSSAPEVKAIKTSSKQLKSEMREIEARIAAANPDVVELAIKLEKENVKSSVMSYFCQTIERVVLEEIYRWLLAKGVMKTTKRVKGSTKTCKASILMYDGLMIRKALVGDYRRLLTDLQMHIRDWSSIPLMLKDKPIDYGYTDAELESHQVPELAETSDEEEAPELLATDPELCAKIVELFPGMFKSHDDGRMASFDVNTGMWRITTADNIRHIAGIVIANREKFPRAQQKDKSIVYWGDSSAALSSGLKFFASHVRDNRWFDDDIQNNSAGKLLFQDGIYDFETATFTPGFNPDIVFHHQANISYLTDWNVEEAGGTIEELAERIRHSLFVAPAFETNHSLTMVVWTLAQGLAGAALLGFKRFLVADGKTSGGRGTLIAALQSAFGSYVGTIKANQLSKRKGEPEDLAKTNGQIFGSQMTARLLLTSESPDTPISSQLVKGLVGGDKIPVRPMRENVVQVQPHFVFCHFGNRVDSMFDQVDDALCDRLVTARYDIGFKRPENIMDPETEKPRDEKIRENLERNRYWRRAFAKIILDAYSPEPPTDALSSSNTIKEELLKTLSSEREAFTESGIVITRRREDVLAASELRELYQSCAEHTHQNGQRVRHPLVACFKNFKALDMYLEKTLGLKKETCKERGPLRDKVIYRGIRIVNIETEESEPEPDNEIVEWTADDLAEPAAAVMVPA